MCAALPRHPALLLDEAVLVFPAAPEDGVGVDFGHSTGRVTATILPVVLYLTKLGLSFRNFWGLRRGGDCNGDRQGEKNCGIALEPLCIFLDTQLTIGRSDIVPFEARPDGRATRTRASQYYGDIVNSMDLTAL